MRAGTLRHRVIVQKRTDTQDSHGQPIPAWSTYATRWASVDPVAASERFVDEQDYAVVRQQVGMRYLKGVNPRMRVLLPREKTAGATGGLATTTGTTLTVTTASGFPLDGTYRVKVGDEIMDVTAGAGTTSWTVVRGKDGTTAATHAAAAGVFRMAVLGIEEAKNTAERDRETVIVAKEES